MRCCGCWGRRGVGLWCDLLDLCAVVLRGVSELVQGGVA